MKPRLVFVEPSKVGTQHISLIEGYLLAASINSALADRFSLEFHGDATTIAALSPAVLSNWEVHEFHVMNPERRRLIRKSFHEVFHVARLWLGLGHEDVLFVSCMLPTSLMLLELLERLLVRRRIFVVLHGEIEGLFTEHERVTSIGYWARRWLSARSMSSAIQLVVLDDFIKAKLVSASPKFAESSVWVVHHPVWNVASGSDETVSHKPRVCFIGYRTKNKGFDAFCRLARDVSRFDFVAIGGGCREHIQEEGTAPQKVQLWEEGAFEAEINSSTIAIFPYVGGYTCSLSAAAIDALRLGTPILATDRPFFKQLADHLGSDIVLNAEGEAEMAAILKGLNVDHLESARSWRLSEVNCSKYGLSAVSTAFGNVFLHGSRVHDEQWN